MVASPGVSKSHKPTAPEVAKRYGEQPSSLRTAGRKPVIARRVWLLGTDAGRTAAAVAALEQAGHEVRTGETTAELAPVVKDYRPDLIVIDVQDQPERGRHVAVQLRADRATRQLPIVLVGPRQRDADPEKADRVVSGPTRRYLRPLDHPSVLAALVVEL
jgi:CheY-like chemotaxis protein